MQGIVLFIAVALVISTYSVLGLFKKPTEVPQAEETIQITTSTQAATTKTTQILPKPVIKTPSVLVKTPTSAATTTKTQVSPYSGKVKISSASHSEIDLSAQVKEGETVNVTNWKLKGSSGEFIIPQGLELFIPGAYLPSQNIVIKQNTQVRIFSAKNPFKINQSFKPNKCFGYLASYYKYAIPYSYSKICPSINRSEICYFSQACQNAILSLQGCNAVDYSKNLAVSSDSTCQAYIDNYISRYLNYGGCIEHYSKDKDFLQNAWHIYAGYDIVCKCNDTLYLYDQEGLIVDKYTIKVY